MQHFKKCIILIISCSFLILGCDSGKVDEAKGKTEQKAEERTGKLEFESLSKGFNSGHKEKKDYVITTSEKWKEIWDAIHQNMEPKPEMPKIDFSKQIIIAVFKGEQSGGGHSIEITSVEGSENSVVVTVKEVSPEPGGMMSMGFVQPYHVVKTNKSSKEISFKR